MFRAHASRPRVASPGRLLATRLRRGMTLGTGAVLTAGLLAGVSTSHHESVLPSDALQPVAAASSPPLRTFTLNIAFSLGVQRARADMRRAVTRLDASVGGFQEISQGVDRDALIGVLNHNNWGWYIPATDGRPLPIVWRRSRFDLVSGRSFMVHGPVGNTPARYINVVRLREVATGRIFGITNTHTIAGASSGAQATNMTRIPYLRDHLQQLRAEMLALHQDTEQVVALGDLNVNYLADRIHQVAGLPTDALGDIVNFDMPLEGSRGETSLLDYTMSLQAGSLDKTAGRIARGFNSDHDAVVVTYDVGATGPPPVPEPAPVFAPGPLTNAVGLGPDEARVVLDGWVRAIAEAPSGTMVRVATPRIRDQAVATELLLAQQRGVTVRVLTDRGTRPYWEQQLATRLSGDSWLRTAGVASRASLLLVDRAGDTPTLTLSTSAPLIPRSMTQAIANAYQATNTETFAAFERVFQALNVGTAADAQRAETPVGEDLTVRFGPYQADLPDPVATDIRPIRCTLTSPRTPEGRTEVRVAVSAWRGERGLALATMLAARSRWGCDVRVLRGPGMGSTVERLLRDDGVAVQSAPLGETLLLVDGRYGDDLDAQRSWTGTGTFDPSGLLGVSQTLLTRETSSHDTYREQFDREWDRS